MKIYVFILLLLCGCSKDEIRPTNKPISVCKECSTVGYVMLPTHTKTYYTLNNGEYCDYKWKEIEGVFDTIEVKYNSITKKNDTTWYHRQVICQ